MQPGGHRWLCTPPLRCESTRRELAEAALHGYIDCFATDHCAFSREDKDASEGGPGGVPSGLAGIGALPHMAWKLFEHLGEQGIPVLARRLSSRPAEVLGIQSRKGALRPGYDADVIVVDFNGVERPVRSTLADAYETWPGRSSRLSFEHVFLRGIEVVRRNELVDENNPVGSCMQAV
jgi:dihydropyrimidinase